MLSDFSVVSENMTIQETSTNVSQQIDLATSSQTTGLNPHKTAHLSTVLPEGMPVSTINHTAISYYNTVPSPLATGSTSKDLKTSTTKTATFSTNTLFTSTAIPLPTQRTPIHTTTNSTNVTEHSYLGKTSTTKMVEAMATEIFHSTAATDLIDTSVFTKNYTVSETSTTKSKSAVGKTTLFLNESTSIATTPCPKHKSTDVAILHTSKSGQEFLVSSAARTVSWTTLEETSPFTTDVGILSTFPPESLLTSTASPVNATFPEIQVAATLSTTDAEMPFTVHSVLPMETIPALRTVKPESFSTNFQDVSSPSMEDAISTFVPKETSFMAFSSITSSPITRTQDKPIVTDAESTHPTITPRTKLVPTLAEASLFPTMEGLVYTQDTPTTDELMLTLISTKSSSTYNASESGLTSVTIKSDYQFFINETSWTSKSGHTLLTSINTTTIPTFMPNETLTLPFQGNTTNIHHSSMTTNITPSEASTESKVTTSSDATTASYTTALFKPTSQWLSNFTSVSGITSIASQPESKLTTLLLKNNSMLTVAVNELPSIPRETPSLDTSTLTDIKPNFSTEKIISETVQIETNGVSTLGGTMAPLPISATTQRVYTTMTKETTSCHPKAKSTIAAVAEASPFSAMLEAEATDESAQMVTASVTVSPFADIENLTTALNNETAIAEVGVSWFSTKLKESTPESSHNGTMESFNSTHTYTVDWTSETSKGNSASSPNSVSTQALPELLSSSTTKTLGITSSTNPSQRTAASLSAGVLSPQTTTTHSSVIPQLITHTFSLPVDISAVTSPATTTVFFDETKVTLSQPSTLARDFTTSVPSVGLTLPTVTMTTELVPPVSPTASTISDTMSTHRDLLHTTSEVTAISSITALMTVSSLTDTLVSSLRPPTPVVAEAISTIPSSSADVVSPSIHTLVCSMPSPNNITIISSTYVSSTTSTSVTTPSASQVEASTYGFSFPYAFSNGGDVSMASGPTETSAGGEAMSPNTFANKFSTSVDRESTTYFVSTPVSTQSVFSTSMVSSDKEQTNISMEKTPRTTGVAEISPSKNSFILDSQSTFPWEMTDTKLSETTEISSHQTHLPSEILPAYPSSENLTTSSTSGSTQSAHTLTSSTTVGVHVSEGSTSLEKTALPSQVQTVTKSLSHDKERTSTLSEYPPRTAEKVLSSSVTHQATGHLATSFVDTFRTTRISHPVLINTTLSHPLSLKTQPEATQIASSSSGSTGNFPNSLSCFTTRLLSTNFTMITPDGSTKVFSVPNEPTNFPKETSMEASSPIYQMASLFPSVTAFTSKKVSDTPTMLMTKSSRTIHSGNWKSVSIGTFGLKSEKSSMPVNNSDFSTTVLYSDTSTRLGAAFTSLSLPPHKTTKTTQASILDITPEAHVGPTSQSTVVSSTSLNSLVVDAPLNYTTAHVSSPTQRDFLSMKTIPTISVAGIETSVIGATPSSLPSSTNTEGISSIPKTMFSLLLSTTQQPSQENEAPTMDILSGITVSSGGVTELINAHSRATVPASGLSSTPSDSFYTSLNTQVSPSSINFKGTPRPTESAKPTLTHLSLDTRKMDILTSELTKSSPCVTAPVLYPSWTQTSTAPPSLTSHLYLPHSTKAKFPLASPMAEYTVWATRITPSITQALLTTSRNTPRVEDSHFPVFTTKVMTPKRMETETLHFPPGTLSTSKPSQIGLVSSDVTGMPSIFTSESLPTFKIPESTSLSRSSTFPPITLAAILHTSEKTAMPVTPGTTLSSNRSVISRATYPTWNLSSLPSNSQTSVSTPSQLLTSSSGEMSESTFQASVMMTTYPNSTMAPLSDGSVIPTQATSATTLGIITADSLTSLPISAKNKDDSPHTSTFLESSPRTTVADNSMAMSEPMTFSRMSITPSITSHDQSIGSPTTSTPTNTSVWSKVPAISESHTLIPSKSTLDSVMSITTTTSTVIGASFPLMSTKVTHPSTATGSSLVSSSFETKWMDSIFSSLFTQASTSPIATVSAGILFIYP